MIAADFAIKDSGIDSCNEQQKLRIGVSVGSGIGGLETIQNNTIILNEKGSISDEALKLIVKISEGSVRDGLSLLDRALISQKIENKEIEIKKMLEK